MWNGDIVMRREFVVGVTIAVAVALATASSAAVATSPTDPAVAAAEKALEAKGLARVGFHYLVDQDVHLREGLKAVRQAKKQVDESNARRAVIEAQIRDADAKMEQWNRALRGLNARMTQTDSTVRQNKLAAQNNVLVSALDEGRQFKAKKQRELDALPNPIDEYVTALIDLSDKMEAGSKEYARLGDDPAVKAAIAKLNEHAPPKVSLGPSEQFASELPRIRHEREAVNSAVIRLEFEGGVPHVKVTLNGNVTEPMVVDSGAAIMTLTAKVGKRLGIKVERGDEVAELVTANGAHVRAHVTHIKSVRLGQFTVNDVEAAILPDGAGGDNLLGGSFLRHFVYRMDLGARELHLSQIGGKAGGAEAAHAAKPDVDAGADDDRAASGGGSRGWNASEWLRHMTGSTQNRDASGAVVLRAGDRLTTDGSFSPPVTFRIRAKTDSHNIRIAYAADQIILGWERGPKQVRIDGGPANGRHKPTGGNIPKDRWINIELTVLPDSLSLRVNGEERYRTEADFSKVDQPLSIFTVKGATVSVKSIAVEKR
jgi:clan AA aspartic protease (TIGR02281 family)